MRFSDIKDTYQHNTMRTNQVQSDFLSHWLDANGVNFADGVLGGLMDYLKRLGDNAASASVQQQNNELYRNEIVQYINAAVMRDEAQDAQNKAISAECDALEQEIAALESQGAQLSENGNKVQMMLNNIDTGVL